MPNDSAMVRPKEMFSLIGEGSRFVRSFVGARSDVDVGITSTTLSGGATLFCDSFLLLFVFFSQLKKVEDVQVYIESRHISL